MRGTRPTQTSNIRTSRLKESQNYTTRTCANEFTMSSSSIFSNCVCLFGCFSSLCGHLSLWSPLISFCTFFFLLIFISLCSFCIFYLSPFKQVVLTLISHKKPGHPPPTEHTGVYSVALFNNAAVLLVAVNVQKHKLTPWVQLKNTDISMYKILSSKYSIPDSFASLMQKHILKMIVM